MSVTLIAEDGSGLPDANAYADADAADDYHDSIPTAWTSTWTSATSDDKDASLVWATRILDESCAWLGAAASTTQALRWPRSGVYTPDGVLLASDEVPQWLINATSELARTLLETNRPAASEERELLSRMDGGGSGNATSLTWAPGGNPRKAILPASVRSMVRPYCSLGGAKVVRC